MSVEHVANDMTVTVSSTGSAETSSLPRTWALDAADCSHLVDLLRHAWHNAASARVA